jgi:hypothetical protein
MSDHLDVGVAQQAASRGSSTLAYSVLRFAAVFLTLGLGLNMTFSGCVLPLSPSFEDPPADRNYPPAVMGTDPVQGFVLPGTLRVTVTDPNVGDSIYLRWIAEYPPYDDVKTRTLSDATVPPSADGKQVYSNQPSENIGCGYLAVQTSVHPITVLITDRPFPTLVDFPNMTREEQITKINDAQFAGKAEAHWVLNVDCP